MIIWLASYPRSGNTFLRVILNSVFKIKTYSIYDDKGDIGADKKTAEIVGHQFLPKDFSIEKARKDEQLYLIKTHELLDKRVMETDKVIYLIRDGRESVLSFTKHQNSFSDKDINIIDTIYGSSYFGSWGEHVSSWLPRTRKNTLLIKFEDLISSPLSFVKKLSLFIDQQALDQKIPTFEELKKVNSKFFRNGKTNSWETTFKNDEHIAFWMKNYAQMLEYGYTYKIHKIFKTTKNFTLLNELSNQNSYLLKTILKQNNDIKKIINNQNNENSKKQGSRDIQFHHVDLTKDNIDDKTKMLQNLFFLQKEVGELKVNEKQEVINKTVREFREGKHIIGQKNNEIEKQNSKVFELETKFSKLQTETSSVCAELNSGIQKLSEQENIIKAKDDKLSEQEYVRDKKDHKCSLLSNRINKADKIVESQKITLKNNVVIINDKEKNIAFLKQQLKDTNNIINNQARELKDIYSSKTYNIISKVVSPYLFFKKYRH